MENTPRPGTFNGRIRKSPVYHGTSGHLAVYMDEWAYESIYTIVYYVKDILCDIKPITRSRMFIRLFCY